MQRSSSLLLAVCAFLLSACAGAQLGSGQNGFRAFETRHFMLYTDLDEQAAREHAERLEQLLFALQETAWESSFDLPLRLNVIMFARTRQFRRYADDTVGGYAFPEELFEPWIVLPAPGFGDGYGDVAHELTHGMAYQAIAHLPRWTSEGLASYFESAHFQRDGSFQIGGVPRHRYYALAHGWDLPSTLLAGTPSSSEARFYGSAWLFVHFLMTKHANAFVAFQDNLARGLSQMDAWKMAFPLLSLEQLDQDVIAYVRAGSYENYSFELAPRAPSPIKVRTLSRADELVLSALLWKNCWRCAKEDQANWHADLALALKLEPENVWATALSTSAGVEGRQESLVRAKATARVHPEHWLSWIALGTAAGMTGELPALCSEPSTDPGVRALALAPRQPYALLVAAMTAIVRGERAQAIAYVQAARRMQPSNAKFLLAGAELLAVLSACAELREALVALRENVHVEVMHAQLASLHDRAARCLPPEPPQL